MMDFEGIEIDDELRSQIEEKHTAEINGLINKRDQLLGQEKKLKEKLRGFEQNQQNLFDKLGISSYDDIDEVLSVKQQDDDKKTELELKRLSRQLEESTKEKDSYYSQLSATIIDGQLKAEFLKAGVKPELVDALALQYKQLNNFQLVKDDAGSLSAVNSIGQSPIEAISEWTKTDASKVWRQAPENRGGGASGSSSAGVRSLKGMSVDEISKIEDRETLVKAMRENGYL